MHINDRNVLNWQRAVHTPKESKVNKICKEKLVHIRCRYDTNIFRYMYDYFINDFNYIIDISYDAFSTFLKN